MRQLRYLRAVSEGLKQEITNNKEIIVIGEDVRKSVRGITKNFIKEFGEDRIIDSPISELALVGCGTGAAITGLRPVIEFQINEFIFFAFDQIANQAAKLRYMSGGKIRIPVTYLVPGSGARGGNAGQHSDNPYPYVLHAGMKVVIPSSPYDAKGLVKSAIREDDPVIVFLPVQLLGVKGEVPEKDYTVPLGKGEIKREGNDITIIATGHLVPVAVEAASEIEEEGISIEVLDPRTLLPLDRDLLEKSISKTNKVIVFDDSNRTCGFAAELSAIISEEYYHFLKAPVIRITRADVPVPFAREMEDYVKPDKKKLINAIKKIA